MTLGQPGSNLKPSIEKGRRVSPTALILASGLEAYSTILDTTPAPTVRPFESQSEVTNLPKQYNDRALSLRIQGRGAWQVCSDSDFRGRCVVVDRDIPDLRQMGLGEAVSSMRPVR